jgi:hypothetical protein
MEKSSNWTIPVSETFPELEHVECLFWYDGPMTSLFKDSAGQRYILHWGEPIDGENRESGDRYLLLLIPDGALDIWLADTDMKLGWRSTFIQATRFAFVDVLPPDGVTVPAREVTSEEAELYMPQDVKD